MRQDAADPRTNGFGHGMQSVWRSFVVCALAATATFATGPAVAHAAAKPSTAPAFTALGQCLAQHKRLLLAFVMDESGSLGDLSRHQPGSDPTAQRVTAAQVAVQGLTQLAGRGVSVDVLLSGFSDDLHTYGGWQTLDATSSNSIATQLDGFRARDRGLDTDFYTALAGVERELSTRAAATADDPCQVVLLFTDGRFDVATHVAKPYDENAADPDQKKVVQGVAALCTPDGPLQSIRKANGEVITLALADPSGGPAEQPDRAFLSRLATGNCSSPGAEHGASFDAANASDLVGQFDAIVSNIRGGTQRLGDCVGSAHAFDVVPAIGSFHVLADTGRAPGDVIVTTPDNRQVRVSPKGAVSTAPTDLAVHATVTSDRFVAIDASPATSADTASSAWSGRWTVNFASAAGSGATCQVFLFGAWKPLLRKMTLRPGHTEKLVLDVVGPKGQVVRLGDLHTAHSISATIANPDTHSSSILRFAQVGNHYETTYAIPRSFTGNAMTFDATFHVVVGGADVPSSPLSTKVPVGSSAGGALAGRVTPGTARTVSGASTGTKSSPLKFILAGALIALGLIAVVLIPRARRRRQTFLDPSHLSHARVAVRVRRDSAPTRLDANGEESLLAFRPSDFKPCPVASGPLRSFSLNDLSFEAVSPHTLFSRGRGEVIRQGRYVTASGGTTLGRRFTKGRVPLRLSDAWVYELDEHDGADENASFVDGHVTVFARNGSPSAAQARRLVDSFNVFLTDIALRLATHAPAERRSATTNS